MEIVKIVKVGEYFCPEAHTTYELGIGQDGSTWVRMQALHFPWYEISQSAFLWGVVLSGALREVEERIWRC